MHWMNNNEMEIPNKRVNELTLLIQSQKTRKETIYRLKIPSNMSVYEVLDFEIREFNDIWTVKEVIKSKECLI